MNRAARILVLAAMGTLVACSAGEQAQEDEAPPAAAAATAMAATMPDTTASALWAHLEEVDYRAAWTLWPDKGELYTGQEPHGMLLTTYLNELALDALTTKAGAMPAGAIVVKENYMPDSTLAATTVMYKVEGYNPEGGDWFWLKYTPDGKIEKEGKVAGCIGCHSSAQGNDWLFTGPLH